MSRAGLFKGNSFSNGGRTGWAAADEHVHYDRLDPTDNKDWLTMLEGDGLTFAHFLVLKGGKVPGIWARQYAYGKAGETRDGQRLIRSGEEYRDSAQGHINLLGIDRVIPPISTGGLGTPSVPYHYPPLQEVLLKSRKLGGLSGVAHGGSLGRQPTAILDTVLGAVDFFEIANTHLYSRELWYRLMNCGYDLPPAAGTDLPNYPFRDPWQPFLGGMRMYVKVGQARDFDAWKKALKRGEAFITSGPLLSFRVNSENPGHTIHLPPGGGEVHVEAELATPIGLNSLELIRNGTPVSVEIQKKTADGVHRWKFDKGLKITESCWLAARGKGPTIEALKESLSSAKAPWIETDAIAHSAVVRVLVGEEPIRSAQDAAVLLRTLRTRRAFYRSRGRFEKEQHRQHMLDLFHRAIEGLTQRASP